MKIFITGGTGFLGSYILRKLVKDGFEVRALKRASSRMDLVADVMDKVEWIEGDVLDIPVLEDAMEGVEKVYHAAAMVSFDPRDRKKMLQVNSEGTANIVNVGLYRGVKKLAYVSSIAAVGRSKKTNIVSEKTKWENNDLNTRYAVSKYLAEQEVWRGTVEGLPAVMINPTIIVGAGYWTETSCKMFKQVDDGLKYYTSGQTGFVDVRDAAEILIRLTESEIENQRYIVSGENMAYKDYFELIAKYLEKQPPSVKATDFMKQLVWRMEWLRSKFTGSRPLITKETAKMSSSQFEYENDKIIKTLDFKFNSIENAVKDTAAAFLASKAAGKEFGTLGFGIL